MQAGLAISRIGDAGKNGGRRWTKWEQASTPNTDFNIYRARQWYYYFKHFYYYYYYLATISYDYIFLLFLFYFSFSGIPLVLFYKAEVLSGNSLYDRNGN